MNYVVMCVMRWGISQFCGNCTFTSGNIVWFSICCFRIKLKLPVLQDQAGCFYVWILSKTGWVITH